MAEVILHSSSGAPNLSQITPPEDGEEFEVQLGESFQHHNTEERYHTLHYAFRPASVESRGVVAKSKDGPIEIEFANANAEQTSSTTYFRGSYQKSRDAECLLIFDPITQTFTLERLSGTARGLKPSGKKPQDSPLANAKIPPPLTINPAVIKRSNENANGTIVKIKKPKLDTSLPVSEEKDSSSSSSSSSESDKSDDELQDDLDIDSFSASLEESLGSTVPNIPGSQPSQTSPNAPLTQSASWIAPQSNIVNTSSSSTMSSLPSYAMMLRDATSTYSKEPPKVEVAPVAPTAPVVPRQEPKLVQITQPITQQLVPNQQQQEASLFSESDSSSSSSSSDSSSDSSSSDSEPEKTGPQ